MNRESFIDTLRSKYSDDVLAALSECSHKDREVDLEELRAKLAHLAKVATLEGLGLDEFRMIVSSRLPQKVVAALTVAPAIKEAA
ncbi:MAG: hypothetical protein P4M08_06550 [Oligoflexia bacterium]|nr:hypothetical protein [Oligoflexia bacterium]